MGKLVDIEVIRKEIEWRKDVYNSLNRVIHGVADAFRQDGRAAMCDDLIKFLDELPEANLPKDLGEVAEKYADDSCFGDPEFTAIKLAFEDGAKWMANHLNSYEQENKRDPRTQEKWKIFREKCQDEGIEPPTYEEYAKRQ